MSAPAWRVATWTALALLAFAANSLFCRWALGRGALDASTFAVLRAGAAAAVLWMLTRGQPPLGTPRRAAPGMLAWSAYAVAFSYSYLRLDTGIGALVLFGVTQAVMIGWGLRRGERPGWNEWAGLALALGGLAWLTVPGVGAPDLLGLGLMAAAGIGWGSYSLLGRGSARPVADNRDAFTWSLPVLGMVSLATLAHAHWTWGGIALAAASGALATGLGYSLWYAALPALTRTRAAIVQLSVPVIAAIAGVVVLQEVVTTQLLVAGALILGGIGLAVTVRTRPRSSR